MKIGFFTMPMHPHGRDYTQTLREGREAVILADKLGFVEAFIGEHVTEVCESIPSCLAFIASVAFETRQIKLGSGTVNLPNNHPAQVAANVAMLDHMLEGRFLFGIGPGGLRSDMEMLGNLDRDRNACSSGDRPDSCNLGRDAHNLRGSSGTCRPSAPAAGGGAGRDAQAISRIADHSDSVVPHSKGSWRPARLDASRRFAADWAATHWPMHARGLRTRWTQS